MKKIKSISVAAAVLLLSLFTVGTAMAGEGSAQTTASYTPGKAYAKVKLTVQAQGNGTVVDVNQNIRQGPMVYDMQEEDEKEFTAQPDTGYIISKIEFNDGDTVNNLLTDPKRQTVHVKMKDKDASLLVQFEQVKEDIKEDTKQEVTTEKVTTTVTTTTTSKKEVREIVPKTGDSFKAGGYIALMAAAIILLVLLIKKRNSENENQGGRKR